jgi:hypothetical protein
VNDELCEQIEGLVEYIKKLAPEVHVFETGEIFEDEHANLEVYSPLTWTEKQCRNLQRQIAERAVDIHMDTGYLILVYVCTPEQQVAEARLEFARAKQKIQATEKILAEAEALGLWSAQPELVAA